MEGALDLGKALVVGLGESAKGTPERHYCQDEEGALTDAENHSHGP